MKTSSVHTLVLGAGPSGLAAAYTLANAGLKPVVLEKDKVSGGLMRSIRHKDFILDIGRKELYNRLARVDEFWSKLLENDYREYSHRGGILFDGHIIDMSPAYQGFLRGMPLPMFLGCCADLFVSRMRPFKPRAQNLEEYWYQQRGRRLTRIANQGFQEKLAGKKWRDVTMPTNFTNGDAPSFMLTMRDAVIRAFSSKETNTFKGVWKHPAKGTGQICEALERGIIERGGQVLHEAKILGMTALKDTVKSVTAEVAGEMITFEPQNLVSSTPAEFLQAQLMPKPAESSGAAKKGPEKPKRVVILVYLFCDEEPRFPHFWLQVTDQEMNAGRIANYAALNADMVPKGKTCLCSEIYCFGDDPRLKLSDDEIAKASVEEFAKAGLITRSKCFDTKVLRFPGADASQNRHNWLSSNRQALLVELRRFTNLYSVNRTDLDIATLAGIESAEAIISGDRSTFDRHIDPNELGIRSERKPFEFRNPPGVEI